MRDPKRIKRILEKLRALWETYPDMRLGQLLVNVERGEGFGSDLFVVEDTTWEKRIDSCLQEGFGSCQKRVEAVLADIQDTMPEDLGALHDEVTQDSGYKMLFDVITGKKKVH